MEVCLVFVRPGLDAFVILTLAASFSMVFSNTFFRASRVGPLRRLLFRVLFVFLVAVLGVQLRLAVFAFRSRRRA